MSLNKKIFVSTLLFITCFISAKFVAHAAGTPTVTQLTPVTDSVPKFKKYEVNFKISQAFEPGSILPYYYYDPLDTKESDPGRSVYGVDGITIDAVVRTPSGATINVPAFYYQEYVRTGSLNSGETMTPTNNYSWKVRYTPAETGNYTYTIKITDKNGSTTYPQTGSLSFTSTASSEKGFVRVAQDKRFLQFDNGTSYIPIASGRQWWACCGRRSFDYEQAFTDFGANGINLTRVWDQNDGYSLTVEGRYDGYSFPSDYNPVDTGVDLSKITKGTQFNQRGNYQEDKIIESAEKNGVYILLSSHGDPYWIWDGSVYEEPWNTSIQAFDSNRHLGYWKRNFRYRVARWGYSTSILGWEAWNEHGHVTPNTSTFKFYEKYGAFQKLVDPYGHLRTTSQGSQAFSPAFWTSGAFDIATYHDYMMISRYSADLSYDDANFIYKFAWCLRDTGTKGSSNMCNSLGLGDGTAWNTQKGHMPWIWGEMDALTSWDVVDPIAKSGAGRLKMLHNTAWAGLFSPIGSSPIDWSWLEEDAATTQNRYIQRKAIKSFFDDIEYSKLNLSYLMTPSDAPSGYAGELIASTNNTIRAYGMKSSDKSKVYVWLQNRNNTWRSAGNTPTAVSGEIEIPGLLNSQYKVEVWNTYTGLLSTTSTISATSNILKVPVSNLNTDYALKITNGSGVPTPTPTPTPAPSPTASPTPTTTVTPTPSPTSTLTPTPTPTSTSTTTPTPVPTLTLGSGDINGDGIVSHLDVNTLISNWNRTPNNSTDQYPDSTINSLDYAVIVQKFTPAPTPTATPTSTATPTPMPSTTATPTTTPTPTATPTSTATPTPTPSPTSTPVITGQWSQFGGNAQRTSYTAQTVAGPWRYKWSWNSADANGAIQPSSHLAVPDMVQPITGGGRVYIVANNTVYALDKNSTNKVSGTTLWTRNGIGNLSSTPAYDAENLYVTSSTGVYKINAANGNVVNSYTTYGSNMAPLSVGNTLYITSTAGNLISLDKNALTQNWIYTGESASATPPSFSSSKNTLVYVTQDLNVHAVSTTGSRKWKTKPTDRIPGNPASSAGNNFAEAILGWPVIAEQHGIVFVRYRIDWDSLWISNPYPSTNSAIRALLWAYDRPQIDPLYKESKNRNQALFALNLDNGTQAFTPAVGNGGAGDGNILPMGPQPIIKTVDGQEVAYVIWRNGLGCPCQTAGTCSYQGATMWCDGREDAVFGEMVLDNSMSGYSAGDVRFIGSGKYHFQEGTHQFDIQTDEMMYMTMSGNTLFHSHWLVNQTVNIVDRSPSLGSTFLNPIKAAAGQNTIWRQVYCTPGVSCNPQLFPGGSGSTFGPSDCPFNATTRECKSNLYSYGDNRSYGAGFYQYHNSYYSGGNSPDNSTPFTVVSDGLVLVKAVDGGIIALEAGGAASLENQLALNYQNTTPQVLGAETVKSAAEIDWKNSADHINKLVTVKGKVVKIEDHMPKGYYIGFTDNPKETFLLRIFSKDTSKFKYNLDSLVGKEIKATGVVTLYWPDGRVPEIIIYNPDQIKIQMTPKDKVEGFVKGLFKWN